nr:condensation domain-containing protein [uncultured bacterium]
MAQDLFAFPTSFAQQRLWFLDQLEPGSPFYNIPAAVRLKGRLDAPALERSLNEVVRRHEVLRTTFGSDGGQPLQFVVSEMSLALTANDLRGLPDAAREVEAERLASEEVRRPFDLRKGPLLRPRLLRLGEEEHILLLTMHHIVSDGWSVGILIREVAALYEEYTAGRPAALPELAIQYADFAHWEREWLQGEVLEKYLSYWKRKLARPLPSLELPFDRPRPRVRGHRGARLHFTLPADLSEAVKAFARREQTTLFVTLLAAFKALLQRYTRQADIVVGSPTANRNQGETEPLIGFFVNTLVLRTDLSGDPSFRELLGRVRETVQEAYLHQELPFERLVEELRPERSLSQTPLFQVMFILQNAPTPPLELPRLTLSVYNVDSGTSKFDLTFSMQETGAGLSGTIEYDADLFDAATVEYLSQHFVTLLRSAADAPDAPVSTLELLPDDERRLLLANWNRQAQRRYPEACIHELFEAQAARTPEAVAVRWERESLTYAELNRRADALARRLRARGVGPEALVGVCLRRTPRLVAALLGVLKAGGAYVPLDPAYPSERLRLMLEDAGARWVLTEEETRADVEAAGAGAEVLSLGDWCRDETAKEEAPVVEETWNKVTPSNLAYVIYTSGSTGRPKGVMLTHRSAAGLLRWAHETFSPAHLCGTLASTSVCFDLSIFELFVPLTGGQCVLLADDALGLADLHARREVTLVNTVPSAMAELLRLSAVPEGVRVVNLAGEALAGTLVEEIYARLPGVEEVWNLYGPTEDTTYSTAALVERGTRKPSIGRPVAGTRLYVLDERQRLAGVGVVGELMLGGEGLARGYWARPGLTAERFIPDGLSGEAGARLYRTGDLARYLSSGEVEYLGRVDQQVKIRGFRIEPGEVEAALCTHPAVREAAVVADAGGAGGRRLVAYVVAEWGGDGDRALGARELRAYLRERLPGPLVPSALVLLEGLPRTPNGKLDRRALPEVEVEGFEPGESYIAPRDALEELVAGIFSDLLGVERVGVLDDFFDLGGHSLLATQVVSRVRDLFGVELPLRSLFETQTVAGIASRIEEARGRSGPTLTGKMAHAPRTGRHPLSFAQERLWFWEQLQPLTPTYNLAAAFRLRGELDVTALEQSFNEIVRRHEVLRTTFSAGDGEPAQVVAPATPLWLKMSDLSHLPEPEREAAARRRLGEECLRPFDLSHGPLLRVVLVRLGPREHAAAICIHHIISDGWSLGVLVNEVAALYESYRAGRAPTLRPLPVQYADFAAWQREWLRGEVLETQLDYWRERLRGAAPLRLFADGERPPVFDPRGARLKFELDSELLARLKALSRREGVTLYMTLLAAFDALLHRYTAQDDIVVGATWLTARGWRPKGSSASSSTCWCCAQTLRATRLSASFCRG